MQGASYANRRKGCILGGAALTLFLATGTAHAATLYNGWNYAIDSFNDASGGAAYEDRGLAFTTVGKTAYFAISSGMPLGGVKFQGMRNNRISQGDVFFNFSSHDLKTAAKFNDPKVFGIRFDTSNDSLGNLGGSNTTLGVFKNMTVANMAIFNPGHPTLQDYINKGYARNVHAMGDLQKTTGDVKAYFGNGGMMTSIASGTKIGSISLLSKSQLTTLGLNFGHFGADPSGNNVYGFSYDRTLMPFGDFTASLFEECINDGVAIKGKSSPIVPEPGAYATLGLGLLTLGGLTLRRKARK